MLPLDVTVSGDLINSENDIIFVPSDDGGDDGVDLSEFVGLWEYVDQNLWLRIYDNETWDFLND